MRAVNLLPAMAPHLGKPFASYGTIGKTAI